jgi:hypothetical protein
VTEEEWLGATAPRGGLDYLCSAEVSAHRRKAGRRKLRLFVCACSRRVWGLVSEGPPREWVELGERLCEGEDVAARIAALGDWEDPGPLSRRHARHAAKACAETVIWHAAVTGAEAAAMAAAWASLESEGSGDMKTYERVKAAERLAQAALLREVVGNPFRPVLLGRALRTSTVAALARAAHDERHMPSGELDPTRLGVLADALEEAGAGAAVISHLRGPGPHVRGCHVVDACLGLA